MRNAQNNYLFGVDQFEKRMIDFAGVEIIVVNRNGCNQTPFEINVVVGIFIQPVDEPIHLVCIPAKADFIPYVPFILSVKFRKRQTHQ
jgi:diphthamide biosynthesis methyltransferase